MLQTLSASFGDTNEITKRQYKGIVGKINPIDTVCPFLRSQSDRHGERETNRKTMINGEMAADVKILPSFANGAWEDCRKYGAGQLHLPSYCFARHLVNIYLSFAV